MMGEAKDFSKLLLPTFFVQSISINDVCDLAKWLQ